MSYFAWGGHLSTEISNVRQARAPDSATVSTARVNSIWILHVGAHDLLQCPVQAG